MFRRGIFFNGLFFPKSNPSPFFCRFFFGVFFLAFHIQAFHSSSDPMNQKKEEIYNQLVIQDLNLFALLSSKRFVLMVLEHEQVMIS